MRGPLRGDAAGETGDRARQRFTGQGRVQISSGRRRHHAGTSRESNACGAHIQSVSISVSMLNVNK